MNRIRDSFDQLRQAGRKGFIPFVTIGDPDVETSIDVVVKLAEVGSDAIELGVPFSDPVADGPTIQRSSQRALANGTTLRHVLDAVREIRRRTDIPLVVFSYLNPLYRYGIGAVARDAAEAGVDAILITDAVDEEAAEYGTVFRSSGIDLISLVAPTTTDGRLEKIASRSSGFLYAVSRAGVTGASSDMSREAEALVERCRRVTQLPIAVGFGISTAEQISEVWRYADAAVVGSAIVARIAESQREQVVGNVESFVKALLPQFAKYSLEP